MLSRVFVAPFLLLLLDGGALLQVVAKAPEKSFKIDGPFIKKFRQLQEDPVNGQVELSRQKRFLDNVLEGIFGFKEDFLNKAWGRNNYKHHYNFYNSYWPSTPQYYSGWSVAASGCIVSNNKKYGLVSSIQECQWMCLQENNFICRSVEYEPNSGTCSLSDDTRASAKYVEPCFWRGWLYLERINDWTDPINACIDSTYKKIIAEPISTLEECKFRCIEETDFVCQSVGYITWTYTCSLSPEISNSPNYVRPCNHVHPDYTYVERLYVPPKTDSCSDDPCGPNSLCWPYGNSFNCTCADGFYGNPPNCQVHQGCDDQIDCPSNLACVAWTCVDPCVNRCGPNANCQVYNHYASCTCPINYTGNPYLYCSEIDVATTLIPVTQTQVINTTTATTLPDEQTDTTTENTQIVATTVIPVTQTQVINTTTTATTLPDEQTDTTMENTQIIETTEAVETQTEMTDDVTTNNPQTEKDFDPTQAPESVTEAQTEAQTEAETDAQTEPTMTETSVTEVTEPLEAEITTVNPEVRSRIPRIDEENIV